MAKMGKPTTRVSQVFERMGWIISRKGLCKGDWLINFLIAWAIVAPPAILFLTPRGLERRTIQRNFSG